MVTFTSFFMFHIEISLMTQQLIHLEAFGGWDRHAGLSQLCLQLVEDWATNTSWEVANHTFNHTTHTVSFIPTWETSTQTTTSKSMKGNEDAYRLHTSLGQSWQPSIPTNMHLDIE